MSFQVPCLCLLPHCMSSSITGSSHLAFLIYKGSEDWTQVARVLLLLVESSPKLNNVYLHFLLAMVTFLSQLYCLWAGEGVNSPWEWREENLLMERWESICKWRWEHARWFQRTVRLMLESDVEDDRSALIIHLIITFWTINCSGRWEIVWHCSCVRRL